MHPSDRGAHRPEIDGLRALAVLAILFYHAGFSWASGGYVGVDVFFVVSGFLITRNLLAELAEGGFSARRFYARRARRILPALWFAIFVTLLAGCVLMAPPDLERLAESAVYGIFSLANVHFWQESGYFEVEAELKPLLHLWSLSVEEQFYLLWPLLLVLLARVAWQGALLAGLVVAVLGSLLLVEALPADQQSTAFFLLPFRVFEFALGGLAAWAGRRSVGPVDGWPGELAALAGLVFIGGAIVGYDADTDFPGLAALAPCVGALLLIGAGGRARAASLLRSRVLVGVGLISYSVYLLHWPLMAFYRYAQPQVIGLTEQVTLIVLSLGLGALSWRWVEQPFRRGADIPARRWRFLAGSGGTALVLAIFAAGVWAQDGLPGRYPDDFYLSTEEMLAERARYWDGFGSNEASRLVVDDSGGFVIAMGNSHAQDLVYALRQNGYRENIVYLGVPHTCYNFGTGALPQFAEQCAAARRSNLGDPRWKAARAVLLHEDWKRIDVNELLALLRSLRGMTAAPIYLVGPRASYARRVPDLAREYGRLAGFNAYSQGFLNLDDRAAYNAVLRSELAKPEWAAAGVFFIDALAAQCGEALDRCDALSAGTGRFRYFDTTHFTQIGAAEFGLRLKALHPELFASSPAVKATEP